MYCEVVGLAGRWSSFCLALRLLPSDQSAIAAAHPGNPHECLKAVVVKWLQKGYDYQRYGPPTWRMLVESVGDPGGGNDTALAEVIAKRHPGMYSVGIKFVCEVTGYLYPVAFQPLPLCSVPRYEKNRRFILP